MPKSSAARVSLVVFGALGDREVLKDAGLFRLVAGMRNKRIEGRTNDLFLVACGCDFITALMSCFGVTSARVSFRTASPSSFKSCSFI
ncbi:hypothetical protein HJB61_05740 [Rhizobium lentis]|nr:hypothetical protein [Rhizobium lentis]